MWHYINQYGEKRFANEFTIRQLITENVIKANTMVWTEGMEAWTRLDATLLHKYLLEKSPLQPSKEVIRVLESRFLGLVICTCLTPFLGGVPGLLVMVETCRMLSQMWKVIPQSIASTIPNKAVVNCFIPFFNLYWIFVSHLGLAQNINTELSRRGVDYRVNTNLSKAYCILWAIGCVFWPLSLLLSAAADAPVFFFALPLSVTIYILQIFCYRSLKDGIIKLLE
jgi:hypothetical protein